MPLIKKTFQVFWLSLTLGLLLCVVLTWPSFKPIKQWEQPESVIYGGTQYQLSIVEMGLKNPISKFFVGSYRHHTILIPRKQPDNDTNFFGHYGHYKEYGFRQNTKELFEYLDLCTVTWDKEGIWFIEPSGHRFFFPKSSFLGGR